MMKTYIRGVLVILVIVVIGACSLFITAPETILVESIEFEANAVTLQVGQSLPVKATVLPKEAQTNVAYSVSMEGVISISEPTNSGLIITGEKTGSVVLIAKADSVTEYLEVRVGDVNGTRTPYIVLPTQVVELTAGARRSLSVSLYDGTIADNATFEWTVQDESIVGIETTANVVVLEAKKNGTTKVSVNHPQAMAPAEIIVYVKGQNDLIHYITTETNVLVMALQGTNRQFNVQLVNGKEQDIGAFTYTIKEGDECVDIIGANNTCNITPKTTGTAIISVSHPKAEYVLDVMVIIKDIAEIPYIELDNTLLILSGLEGKTVKASLKGNVTTSDYYAFTYELEKEGIVRITQANNEFYITPIGNGTTKLRVSNPVAEYPREVLLIVDINENQNEKNYYITTTQNIIQTEIGAGPTTLSMVLVGGNIADKNSFSWEIEDSRIVDVQTADGTVVRRAVFRGIEDAYAATAMVEPKEVGSTKITVRHPKTEVETVVIVKVYPKGTFETPPIILKPESSLLKVITGESKTVQLSIVSGKASDVGELSWSTEEATVATATGVSLTGQVSGVAGGVTKLMVTGETISRPCTATVLVGTVEELESKKVIYVENPYQTLQVGQTVYVELKSNNNQVSPLAKYSVQNDGSDVVEARIAGNVLALYGLGIGQANLRVSCTEAENEAEISVSVQNAGVSLEHPFYFAGDAFIGIVAGTQKTVSVNLVGAPESEKGLIRWTIGDSEICKVVGNGASAVVTAIKVGQTELSVSHAKAEKEKRIVLFVAETEAELEQAVVLHTEDKNNLLPIGGRKNIRLITNASSGQIAQIEWSVDDASVVQVEDNHDSAFIIAKGAGNAKITVTHPLALRPLYIYVSVSEQYEAPDGRKIAVPSIVEMVAGKSKIITASLQGFSELQKDTISWEIKDPAIATISSAGESAYVFAKNSGITEITVSCSEIGFSKQILLVCAKTEAELESRYVIGIDRSYMKMPRGTEIDVRLLFGRAGFPEEKRGEIQWSVTSNDVLELYANGERAHIRAENVGLAEVQVSSPISNTITFRVLVYDEETPSTSEHYSIVKESIIGVVVGATKNIQVRLFDKTGREVPFALSSLSWSVDDVSVASIAANGGSCLVTAQGVGQTYINIDHPKLKERERILLYTAASAEDLSVAFPLGVKTNHRLITIGETVTINILTVSEDVAKLQEIKWSVSNSAAITYEVENKKTMSVTGRSEGSSVITVTHPGSAPVKIYVTVVKEQTSTEKSIQTERIIGMVAGESRITSIITNLSEQEISQLQWSSSDGAVVTVSGNGTQGLLQAHGEGQAYVTVGTDEITRSIFVYVRETQEQVDAQSAMNVSQKHYRLAVGSSVTVNMRFEPNSPDESLTVWEDIYQNNVVAYTSFGGVASFIGVAEGIAAISVSNPQCMNSITLYFEVRKESPGSVEENEGTAYLTASRTLYVLDPEETTHGTKISVTPVGLPVSEHIGIMWETSNPAVVSVYPNGRECEIYPNGEGTAFIRASHAKSQNMLTITVIVKKSESTPSEPGSHVSYVEVPQQVITVKEGATTTVKAVVKNASGSIDPNGYTATISQSSIAGVEVAGATVSVTGKTAGQTLIKIHHPQAEHEAEVLVIVEANIAGVVYLTTGDNYAVLEVGRYRTMGCELKNYDETNGAAFSWSSSDTSIVTVQGSGKQAVVTAVKTGTAQITVRHPLATYPLSMLVRVTEADVKPVYITTGNNIVQIDEGSTGAAKVQLVNGSPQDESLFQWSSNRPDIATIVASGSSAVIQGIKEGVATITVSNPASLNTITIAVMVQPKAGENAIYIATDTALVEMKPTDAMKNLSVRLIGGKAEDIYGFVWAVTSYESVVKYADGTSKEVVQLVASADKAYVIPKNEGEATIRVTHPKTNYKLDIKCKVSLYNEIRFASPSVSVKEGETQSAALQAPTGTTVIYETSNASVAAAAGTNKLCLVEGFKAGIAVITARSADGRFSDEMLVKVEKNTDVEVKYIKTSTNLVTFTTTGSAQSVTANLVGTGFTSTDNDSIVWASQNTGIVSTYGTGRTCSFTPKGAGETEVILTHSKLPGYQKRIYVQVTASETTFTISDQIKQLTEGEQDSISVTVTNVPDIDYNRDVTWSTSDPTIVNAVKAGDGSQCFLVAKKAGTATITATYKSLAKTCTVVVNQPKTLTIATSAETVPQQTIYLSYVVTPSDSEVSWFVDTASFVTVVHDAANRRFEVKGTDRAGYTTLTVQANSLTATCLINNSFNYFFDLAQPSLRAEPRGTYTIDYNVNPPQDTIQVGAYDTNIATVTVNSSIQRITVVAKKSGFTEVPLVATSSGTQISLPIYLFYDEVPVGWSVTASNSTSTPKTYHSRVDEVQLALYLADGERLTFSPNVNATLYPGNDVRVTKVEYQSVDSAGFSISTGQSDSGIPGKVYIQASGLSNYGYSSDYLYKTKYTGLLKLTYERYSGGQTPTKYTKTYMVYSEEWRRK